MGRPCQKSKNKASSGQKRDNKRSGVEQKGQQKVAGRKRKSIHDNPSTEDGIIQKEKTLKRLKATKTNTSNEVNDRDVQQSKW